MFQKGDRVVCVNEKMDPISAVLNKGQVYTVKEHLTLEEYEKLRAIVTKDWPRHFLHGLAPNRKPVFREPPPVMWQEQDLKSFMEKDERPFSRWFSHKPPPK